MNDPKERKIDDPELNFEGAFDHKAEENFDASDDFHKHDDIDQTDDNISSEENSNRSQNTEDDRFNGEIAI